MRLRLELDLSTTDAGCSRLQRFTDNA